tara:strand:+ start:346 stop:576 length:231 start_codon:yes stop_codon:yes gene_type:complete
MLKIESISDFWELLTKAVELAESLWSAYQGAGEDKKAWVVELINTHVDIPFVPLESLEAQIIGTLVDLAVELVINK